MLGKEISTLVNEDMSAGTHQIKFDATNQASGMYIYRLSANGFVSSKTMMLLK